MSSTDVIQVFLVLFTLACVSPILGAWMAKVFEGEKHILSFLRPLERFIYHVAGVKETDEMNWKQYSFAVLLFSILSFVIVFLIQIFQASLPLNPQKLPGVPWISLFNCNAK